MKLTMPAVACLLLMVSPLAACLWDFDTIQDGNATVLQNARTDHWQVPAPSKPFYEWRIEDRQKRIAEAVRTVVAALYDDLAVAPGENRLNGSRDRDDAERGKLSAGAVHDAGQPWRSTFLGSQLEKGMGEHKKAIEMADAQLVAGVYQKAAG